MVRVFSPLRCSSSTPREIGRQYISIRFSIVATHSPREVRITQGLPLASQLSARRIVPPLANLPPLPRLYRDGSGREEKPTFLETYATRATSAESCWPLPVRHFLRARRFTLAVFVDSCAPLLVTACDVCGLIGATRVLRGLSAHPGGCIRVLPGSVPRWACAIIPTCA